ncbi:MAG: cysteine desulfurase [Bdellovibrionales bacterium]|nr:cysteine desulfurase [Bdellovibrionales bacterium]
MPNYRFFDTASTTKCCESALKALLRFSSEEFAHPSSAHQMGRTAAQAIETARAVIARAFGVPADHVIFTGGGTESDNLAVYGVAGSHAARRLARAIPLEIPARFLCSDIEHPAVWSAVDSVTSFGFERRFINMLPDGQPDLTVYREQLAPHTAFVSFMSVNNVTGAVLPVEELCAMAKQSAPGCVTHSDCVQGFAKVPMPRAGGPVDLVSISAHKIGGPKGIGALIALNPGVLDRSRFRPLMWGGGQEEGWRGGTQNAGMIAAFGTAVEETLANAEKSRRETAQLRERLRSRLVQKNLLDPDPSAALTRGTIRWLSPSSAVPQVVSLSLPGIPSSITASRLEERGCLVATGSACSSGRSGPDRVLQALGFADELASSGIRVSLCCALGQKDVDHLVDALEASLRTSSS